MDGKGALRVHWNKLVTDEMFWSEEVIFMMVEEWS